MDRVSTNLPNDNMQFFTRQRQVDMSNLQSQMASQSRILNLRDDPASASHATRYESFTTRLERYSDNIQHANSVYKTTENGMRQALDILQEVRQLAVQGANGTYSPQELSYMATQVDEYLGQLVQVANSVDADGTAVFAGYRTKAIPFRTLEGTVPGSDKSVVTAVEYNGNIGVKKAEVGDNQYVNVSFPGNDVFWAENQAIFAARDATNYVLGADATISVDDVPVKLKQGDNIYAIISKINDSDAAVKARLDPVSNGLVIETTSAHQLWVRDEGGTVMQDLGVTKDSTTTPPHNIATDATRMGGSMFDVLMNLRDNMLAGNQRQIGGDSLRSVDSAMNNLLSNVASVGAKSSRMDLAFKTTEKMIPDYKERLSHETDIDITKAITDYKVLELTHQAALQTAAKVLQPTLLDFLR